MIELLKSAFQRPGRIQGLDAARALALLGMFATHTLSLSTATGIPEPADVLAGKAAALFAVLAGFSIALSTRKYDTYRAAAVSLVARGFVIAMIGLVLGAITTNLAVILVNYGVMFAMAACVFRAPTRVLAALAPAWLIVTPVAGFAARMWFDIPRMTEVPNTGHLADPQFMVTAIGISGYYPVLQWFGYILVGLLLSRLDWSKIAVTWRAAAGGATAAAIAYLTSWALLAAGGMDAITRSADGVASSSWGSVEAALHTGSYGTVPTDTWWWLAVSGPHTSTPFDMVYTAGIAVLAIALCTRLCQRMGDSTWYLFPLLAAGSMPLTLYSAHVVLREMTDNLAVHVVLLVVAAVLWRLHTTRPGPLEWGTRELVQLVAPSPRRSNSAAEPTADRHGGQSTRTE